MNLVHTIRHRKNLPTSEEAQWHTQSNRVPFGSSSGEGQEPAQATDRGWRQSPTPLNDPPITGPSRCRQTWRVTSSQPAQIIQLVPQDDTTQCNALEALQTHSRWWNQVNKWMECVAQLQKGVHKCKRSQESGQGRPHPLFIATQTNRTVIPLGPVSARAPDTAVPGTRQGGGALQRSNSNGYKLAIGTPDKWKSYVWCW
jgi:hypothetical protein